MALVVLGVVLHSLYMLSIFDIYFKSPIVSGMEPEPLGIPPPANRLVLFIGACRIASLFPAFATFGKGGVVSDREIRGGRVHFEILLVKEVHDRRDMLSLKSTFTS